MTTTEYTSRAFIIVRAADLEDANLAAQDVVGDAGRDTFSVPLVPGAQAGAAPVHSYACDWQMTPEQRTALEAALTARGVNFKIWDRDHWDPARGKPDFGTVLGNEGLKHAPVTQGEEV